MSSLEFYSNDSSSLGVGVRSSIRSLSKNTFGVDSHLTFSTTSASRGLDTEAMRIDYAGNVGIGTDSPSANLDVRSSATTAETIAQFGNGNIQGGLKIKTNGNLEWGLETLNTRSLTFGTNNTERMRINSAGNVGIGTDSPSAKLEVAGSTIIDGGIGVASSGVLHVRQNGDGSGNGITLTSSNATSHRIWKGANGSLNIGSSTLPSSFVQTTSGNVGIGATNPTTTLDVNGQRGTATNLATTKTAAGFDLNSNTNGGSNSLTIGETNQTSYFLQHANSSGTTAYDIVLNPYGGNVGIGTDSPGEKLTVSGNGRFSNGSQGALTIKHNYGYLQPNWGIKLDGDTNTSGGYLSQYVNLGGFALNQGGTYYGGGPHRTDANSTSFSSVSGVSGEVVFYTNTSLAANTNFTPAERMRITSGGNVLIGTTGTPNGTSIYGSGFIQGTNSRSTLNMATSSTILQAHLWFYNPNGAVGYIATSGSATQYVTSSDYRLKEDLQDFAGLDMVSKISVYDYKWKTDESRSYGVMAHELQDVLPDAVSGEKDAEEMQGVDYSKIVPLLIKSIQELTAKVERLEAK